MSVILEAELTFLNNCKNHGRKKNDRNCKEEIYCFIEEKRFLKVLDKTKSPKINSSTIFFK